MSWNLSRFTDIRQFAENSVFENPSGLLRLNRFVCIINAKKFEDSGTNTSSFSNDDDALVWNVFKVNCPDIKIAMEQKEVDAIPRYYFKTWQYDDLSVSFIESADLAIKNYFYTWMNYALNAITFERKYYDDITADWLYVCPLNNNGEVEKIEKFTDVVPITISSVDYDLSDEGNQLSLTTVKFKYLRHTLVTPQD